MNMASTRNPALPVPGENVQSDKVPGHWLLARLGKRVLRPGGLNLTRRMIAALELKRTDEVVEFAPGMGITAQITLKAGPSSYRAVEYNPEAARQVEQYLTGPNQSCIVASAHDTCLPTESATVVYGEAMLSMQPNSRKLEIMREAARILKPGGRYAIHELSFAPANISPELQAEVYRELAQSLHVGATPLSMDEWRSLLESAGFTVTEVYTAPMALLEPGRILADEGFLRMSRILFNLLRDPAARKRVLKMRAVFSKHKRHLAAVAIVAEKRA